jgi:leader peptidase (prepilin peptidase)/N-methyltransferase
VTGLAAVAAAAVGVVVGAGSGALAVWLERVERLEEEEGEERSQYEAETAALDVAARGTAPGWQGDRYGWTYLEWLVSPLAAAAGFAAFAAHESFDHGLVIHLLWVTVFVHILAFDIKHRLILNKVTYPAIALALALAQVSPGLTFVHGLFGAAVVYLFFWIQSLLLGGERLGMGDAKLGALVGAVTGFGLDADHLGAVYAVVAAALTAGVVAVLLLVTRIRGLKDPIPYGPFLCAGAALILFTGPSAG